ncbi:hypothetical protein BC834DRAFT_887257, partial [Gloeopeniophorella convolvens]
MASSCSALLMSVPRVARLPSAPTARLPRPCNRLSPSRGRPAAPSARHGAYVHLRNAVPSAHPSLHTPAGRPSALAVAHRSLRRTSRPHVCAHASAAGIPAGRGRLPIAHDHTDVAGTRRTRRRRWLHEYIRRSPGAQGMRSAALLDARVCTHVLARLAMVSFHLMGDGNGTACATVSVDAGVWCGSVSATITSARPVLSHLHTLKQGP